MMKLVECGINGSLGANLLWHMAGDFSVYLDLARLLADSYFTSCPYVLQIFIKWDDRLTYVCCFQQ